MEANTKQDEIVISETNDTETTKTEKRVNFFKCSICNMKEKFEYFGRDPPFLRNYNLLEDCYVVEDPFKQPNLGEILILGSTCIKCKEMVCKDSSCSIYFDGTYCLNCAKQNSRDLPKSLQDKINRIS